MSISVVIPLYNKEKYIGDTVRSVLNQTYADFEVIIVDDGSSDNSAETVRAFTDKRIKLITQTNQGVSQARNRGAACARFDMIAFLDADDEWCRDYLAKISELSRKYPAAGMYGTNYYFRLNRQGKVISKKTQLAPGWEGIIPDYREFYGKNVRVQSSSVAVKKSVFDAVGGFDAGEIITEDLFFIFKVLRKYTLAYVNAPFIYYNKEVEAQASSKIMDVSRYCFLNELGKLLADKTAITQTERRLFKHVYDSQLLTVLIVNLKHKQVPARKYFGYFKTVRGKLTGFILGLLSFFPKGMARFLLLLGGWSLRTLRAAFSFKRRHAPAGSRN
jgi:glycosyltransferase involved in cell wall biosynthesis